MQQLLEKYEKLLEYIRAYGSVAVAFSGGVDSTFLLYAAREALPEHTVAITLYTKTFPEQELVDAKTYCENMEVKHVVCPVDVFQIKGFQENPKERCYICKKALFTKMLEIAREQGAKEILEGTNVDDTGDYRPGMRAIAELQIKSPLKECGFSKNEIRELSKYFQLPTWEKPSLACLATRFPYGEVLSTEKLQRVERAEAYLRTLSFVQFRVRSHGDLARIELLPEDMAKMLKPALRKKVYTQFQNLGFSFVSLDLMGYRTGSMNVGIEEK